MKSLLSRLENATEGSHDLDYDIHVALGWQDNDECGWSKDGVHTGTGAPDYKGTDWPHYTTSLDAALTLVPEGAYVKFQISRDRKTNYVWVEMERNEAVAVKPTVPLALCIASLKARE